ncbi:heterokaryon incompatibility protein-domain-containing protein [Apiospora arundinis]|uniref:Heterokaryon incompatibility protein-domain-containing protein n=1 Tax=Apiospora arundinis TaxID=335852 RepID=A0ABR2IYR0_9PEZI
MAIYRDVPVTGRQIRILDLAAGAPTDPLAGELLVVPLSSAADYEAMSYVWGPSVFSETISLPSGPLAITASLDAALRRFRHINRTRRVWADAICINQRDKEEKGVQVAMMGDVYNLARRVLIWVGKSGEVGERNGRLSAPVLALWMVRFLGDFAIENRFQCTGSTELEPQRVEKIWDAFLEAVIRSTAETEHLGSTQSTPGAPRPSLVRGLLCCYSDDTEQATAAPQHSSSPLRHASQRQQLWSEDPPRRFQVQCPCGCKYSARITTTPQSFAGLALECLGELLANSWFSRMWVLQEAVLAKDALFHYGGHAIPLQQLYYAIDTLKMALDWHQFGAAQLDLVVVKRAALLFTIVGWSHGATKQSLPFGTILYKTRSLEYSEPRDRVYGLLSMVDQDFMGDVSVRPDYTTPLARLWARVTAAVLSSRPSLTNNTYQVLYWAGLSGRQRPMSRPSWACDFGYLSTEAAASWERKVSFYGGSGGLYENPLTGNYFQQDFIEPSASGESKLDINYYDGDDEHGYSLTLRGIAVAKISHMLPNSQFPNHPQEGLGVLPPEKVVDYAEHCLFPWYIKCMRFLFNNNQATYEGWKPHLRLFLICQQGCVPRVPPDDIPPADAPALDKRVSALRAAADHAVDASMVEAPAHIRIDPAQMVVDLIFFVGKMPSSWELDLDRVLAITHDKKIAWVPSASQPGDLVMLFAGVPVPMITRPVGGHGAANAFELVGDAYVEGSMSGRTWPENASKLRTVCLM